MFTMLFFKTSILIALLSLCAGQEYDFAAEIKRQCLVPDPVGLLDCVENKVTLPYLTSWVDCTNSLGQNVKTSADIINYRCKSVWEGKAVIPEVIYIKDCVIEKTGLPAKNVSAEVLGAYKECENNPQPQVQAPLPFTGVKTAPIQQQPINRPTGPQMTMPRPQLIAQAPMPIQQPYSQQSFAIYPPPQQAPITQQQMQTPFMQQQQAPFGQQQLQPVSFIQQQPPPFVQPQPLFATIPEGILLPPIFLSPRPAPKINQQQIPSGQPQQNQGYQYQIQVQHPVQQSIKA